MAGGRKKGILTGVQRARLIEAGKAGRDPLNKMARSKGTGPGFDPKWGDPTPDRGIWEGREAIVLLDRRVGLNEEQDHI